MKTTGNFIQWTALAVVSVVALAACGSSGGGAAAPVGTAIVSQGVVTAKGSVFVNGIEFSTTGATITIDDNPGVESDLKVGMTVKVKGTSDDATKKGVATRIEARDALEGKIDSVDAVNNTITVMGQTVRIEDNVTRLNDDDTVKVFSAAGLTVGAIVEVNGFADDNGGLRATRVAKKANGEFEAKGFVTGLTATSFGLSPTAGGASVLTVNFAAGLLPAGTANGSLVQVKSASAVAGGAITATLIHLEDRLGVAGEKVEVEGIVSSGTVTSFIVNGQQVVSDSSTVFEGGVSADFATGVKLEAEGTLNSGGILVASKISFRSNIKIEADASNVTASGLTLLGKSIVINQFTVGSAVNGDHVEVRAMLDRDGNLVATRIVVKNGGSPKIILQGPVSAADSAAGTVTILGSTLVSNGATEWRTSSTALDPVASKSAFFAQLQTNVTIVKVRWVNGSALTDPFKEAEIELGK